MSRVKKSAENVVIESLFFSRTNDFLNIYLTRQAGKSFYTCKTYKSRLGTFYDYIKDVRGISPMEFLFSQCDYQFILDYSQYLQTELHLKNTSVNSHLAAIRAYLEYASDCDSAVISVYIQACRVPLLTVPTVQQPIIEAKDLTAFLDSPKDTHIGNRDRFILILLYDSAIRVSELVGITLGDIIKDTARYTILVHGKGRKERCITLSERATSHLKNYLYEYHDEHEDISSPLLYTTIHGNRFQMSTRNIERIVNKYGVIAKEQSPTIPNTVTPHTLRRTRATMMYRNGVPIEQVAASLGHKFVETTRTRYASPSLEQMKEIIEKGSNKEPGEKAEWTDHVDEIKKKFGL